MGWPLSQDYNEAIQSPERNFADSDLRRGQATANSLGLPMPYSGNFADVYQLRCPDGSRWAVKCFTREVPGLRDRYLAISEHLRRAHLPFMVDFSYLEEGIRVFGHWFPVLKMKWIEGLTLNQFVARSANEPVLLGALLQIWGRMTNHLRAARVAHGDLQHGNVLLVPDANTLALKLVDYDGMWVPALAGRPSGEVGHPAYQHPERLRDETYGPEVDRVPVLLVVTALRALQSGGRALWQKYDNGDNLLFRQQDLEAPTRSPLFYELLKSSDPVIRALTQYSVDALRRPLAQAPLLEDLVPGQSTEPAPSSGRPTRSPGLRVIDVHEPESVAQAGKAGDRAVSGSAQSGEFGWRAVAIAVGIAVAIVIALAIFLYLATSTPAPRPPGRPASIVNAQG
jgi:serine/threonine protein kinase